MRGWIVLLFLVAAGAGVWFLGPWQDAAPDLGSPDEAVPEDGEERRGEDQVVESRERAADGSDPKTEKRRSTPKFTIPVTLIAHAIGADGKAGEPLDGFRFRVTDDRGRELMPWQQTKSGHQLKLGVGAYAIEVTLADRTPPGPAKFTISKDSEPTTLRFPFGAVEALLLLEVLDATTKRPVAAFRATIETRSGTKGSRPKTRFVPKPESNPLPIPAARGDTLVVKIEAEGYTPGKPVTVTFDGASDRLEHQLFLAPAAKFTGVEIHVTDAVRAPIQEISVLVEKKLTDGSFAKVWRRRTREEKGIYKLPDLAPAHYRLQLRAVDSDGLPTLHLAHSFEVPFTGNEHVREYVTMNKGGGIELQLTDGTGRTVGKDVSVRLTDANGKTVETIWRPLADGKPDPKAGLSADHLTQDAHARLLHALPEGTYKIELRLGKGAPLEEQIYLRAGEVLELRRGLAR